MATAVGWRSATAVAVGVVVEPTGAVVARALNKAGGANAARRPVPLILACAVAPSGKISGHNRGTVVAILRVRAETRAVRVDTSVTGRTSIAVTS